MKIYRVVKIFNKNIEVVINTEWTELIYTRRDL